MLEKTIEELGIKATYNNEKPTIANYEITVDESQVKSDKKRTKYLRKVLRTIVEDVKERVKAIYTLRDDIHSDELIDDLTIILNNQKYTDDLKKASEELYCDSTEQWYKTTYDYEPNIGEKSICYSAMLAGGLIGTLVPAAPSLLSIGAGCFLGKWIGNILLKKYIDSATPLAKNTSLYSRLYNQKFRDEN